MTVRTSVLLILSLFVVQSAAAQAKTTCSCNRGSGTPEEEIGFYDPVFAGHVNKIELAEDDDHLYDVDMTVLRSFGDEKLNTLEEIRVIVINGCVGGCGYCGFEEGKSFMVYAARWEHHDDPYVSLCSRTGPLTEAEEDLEAFGALDLLEPKTKARCGGPDNVAVLQSMALVLLLMGLVKVKRAV